MRAGCWMVMLMGIGSGACADDKLPAALRNAAIDQRLNAQIPLDLSFRDEQGRTVALASLIQDKPVILVLAYYRCPMLCTLTLNGLVQAMTGLAFDAGDEFEVITISFDPSETAELAAAKKAVYLERYDRPGAAAGWHFLTGDKDAIDRVCESVGFRYSYDAKTGQFAHGSGIMVATPGGRVARYFFGVDYSARDLRFALVEASANRIGTPIDQVMLFCYRYDGSTGKYTASVMGLLRASALGTVVLLSMLLMWLIRRERQRRAVVPVEGHPIV